MKKDYHLEREFNAYFDGVTPHDNATDNAKKLIQKKARTKSILRVVIPTFATLAAVSGIAVLAVNVLGQISVAPSNPATPNTTTAPEVNYSYYTTDALNVSALNAYSADLPSGLNFIKKLELAKNAAVYDLFAYASDDGSISLVRADVCVTANGYRHDTTVYVEYTPEHTVYEPLRSFYDGDKLGASDDLISYTQNNGEHVCNILMHENGVRYYISIESADRGAYQFYLSLID